MSEILSIVASHAQDLYYQNYQSDIDFFTWEDFVFNTGSSVTDYYNQAYERMRAENRSDKEDEIVAFSPDVLSSQEIHLKWESDFLTAKLKEPYLSFAFDQWNTGIQELIPDKSDIGLFKRSNISEIWKFKHLPVSNNIYWYANGSTLLFFKNSNCSAKRVTVLYVPAPHENMKVPDTIVSWVITNTVMRMKQLKDGTIIKKDLDRNQNATLQTEINPMAIR